MPLALDTSPQTEQDRFSFFSRPNCSLTRTERDRVFWGIATVTLLVASVFSWLGYWPGHSLRWAATRAITSPFASVATKF